MTSIQNTFSHNWDSYSSDIKDEEKTKKINFDDNTFQSHPTDTDTDTERELKRIKRSNEQRQLLSNTSDGQTSCTPYSLGGLDLHIKTYKGDDDRQPVYDGNSHTHVSNYLSIRPTGHDMEITYARNFEMKEGADLDDLINSNGRVEDVSDSGFSIKTKGCSSSETKGKLEIYAVVADE